jgi:predicted PurR-regulated permease PerM
MSEHRHIPEPGEMVYTPRSSWAPAWFAVGALALVCGIYAAGFIFSPFIYAIAGAIIALFAFRALAKSAIAEYFRLPRRQHVRGSALPVEALKSPKSR